MITGLDRLYHELSIILFLVSHFYFLFIPCGRLSWLPVRFLLHVKYTLSYRMYRIKVHSCHYSSKTIHFVKLNIKLWSVERTALRKRKASICTLRSIGCHVQLYKAMTNLSRPKLKRGEINQRVYCSWIDALLCVILSKHLWLWLRTYLESSVANKNKPYGKRSAL